MYRGGQGKSHAFFTSTLYVQKHSPSDHLFPRDKREDGPKTNPDGIIEKSPLLSFNRTSVDVIKLIQCIHI
jgi:hypothetical protein